MPINIAQLKTKSNQKTKNNIMKTQIISESINDPLMNPVDLSVGQSIDIYNPELLQNARKMLNLLEIIKMWQPIILERFKPGVESEIFRDVLTEINEVINHLNENK